jgi:hypothetical protein
LSSGIEHAYRIAPCVADGREDRNLCAELEQSLDTAERVVYATIRFMIGAGTTPKRQQAPLQPIDAAVAYAVAYIVQAPNLLFVIASARGSGELWIYLYFSYYKKSDRNNQYINTHIGKTIVGLGWMSLVFIPTYYVVYGFHQFRAIDALDLAVTVFLYSLVFMFLVTLATIKWKAPR